MIRFCLVRRQDNVAIVVLGKRSLDHEFEGAAPQRRA
jgi:hypothetical protein